MKLTVFEHLVKFFHTTLVSFGKEFHNILYMKKVEKSMVRYMLLFKIHGSHRTYLSLDVCRIT